MYYVSMNDTFMSGWGRAEGLTNKLVFVCDTLEEALIVQRNANRRGDMIPVRLHAERPKFVHKDWETTGSDYELGNFYIQIKDKSDYSSWYTEE